MPELQLVGSDPLAVHRLLAHGDHRWRGRGGRSLGYHGSGALDVPVTPHQAFVIVGAGLTFAVLIVRALVLRYRRWRSHRCDGRRHTWVADPNGFHCSRCTHRLKVGEHLQDTGDF